jgi:Glycosyl transferase family 11
LIGVKLLGGLGNQMFQYAAGRALALRLGTDLILDLSWFDDPGEATPRAYELDCFNLEGNLATSGVENRELVEIREWGLAVNDTALNASDGSLLVGYWQSEKYFVEFEEVIRRDFSFRNPLSGKNLELNDLIGSSEAVSIHIRRGDYVTHPGMQHVHGLVPEDYYVRAANLIASRCQDPRFFIFSDAPEWAKENVKLDYPTTYIDHNPSTKAAEDMRLMTRCRHHIIANSSFSWWGAWLGVDPQKIVIAPQKWFADESKDTSDLLPDAWERV